ncbi:hypothetical protein I316_01354 [Kwoniella heveanensis BCC8398]|uniref:Uncharacterized protein n=1 Tax=Kwoniella heveanensis BCC8398 TaxID=1296120 RepID=A0A1B9H0E2_9TREE|nr:hypothetical protein I316_01354 [Kwoniella heveanensis BCC8398]
MTIDTTDNLKPGASRDLSPKRPPTPTPLEPSRPDKKARRTPITIPADIIAHIAGKILFPKVSVMTIEAEAVFQLLDWFDRHRESSLFFGTSRNRFVEALEKVCKPLHCCVTFPRFTSRHFRIFEAHRMAFKDRYTVPSSGEYAQDKVRNAFEKMFSRSADIVNTIRPRGLKSLTLHNYRKGELNSREVTSLRLFCTTCECEEAGKRNPKECFQHANIKSHLSAFKELARGIIDMREGRFKMLWRRKDLAERWELISPPEYEEENLQSGSWSELKEKILMKYPAWENENSVMVDYQYAAPCICCGTKDGMFGSAEDP